MTEAVPASDQPGSAPQGLDPAEADPVAPVLQELRRLREAFDAKIRYDEVRERLVESTQQELDTYRRGLYQQLLRPLLLDVVAMYDDLAKLPPDVAEGSTETAKAFAFFRTCMTEALSRNGVEKYSVDGDTVDRSRQKVIDVVNTDELSLDRQVARRLRPGFEWDGKVLRPEWVLAFRYNPSPPGSPTTAPEQTEPRQTDADG